LDEQIKLLLKVATTVNHELYEMLRGLSASTISALTTTACFQRGRRYQEEDRVVSITWDTDDSAGRLTAKVRGTKTYRVIIYLYDGELMARCNCPAWDPDLNCKHVVCVLLTARETLDEPTAAPVPPPICHGAIIREDGELMVALADTLYLNAFKTVMETFKSPFVDGRTAMVRVPYAEFYEKLPEFTKRLQADGIDLHVNGKRPELMKLDVSIDTAQSSRTDWFELAPHILADGIELTDEQRDELFSRTDVFVETNDTIKLLDPQAQAMLDLLAKMFSVSGRGMTLIQKQGIVEMPRLRMLDLIGLRQCGGKVTLSEEDEQLMKGLADFKAIAKVKMPEHFVGKLRSYQHEGYQWLAFLYSHRFGACLADDMGLGKTIQVIAFLGGIAEGIIPNRSKKHDPHLIVLPPTLVFNWQHELETFYPSLRVLEYTSATKNKNTNFADYDVVLTTYDRVRIDIEFLQQQQFHVLILDEAQAIKNMQTGRTAAIRQLNSLFTIAVTGTPIENHLGEYYSIIDVAVPGLLPDYKEFMRAVLGDDVDDLIKKTRPFVLRRTKDKILKDLPAKVESNVLLNMAADQQKLYATTAAQVKRLIDDAYLLKTSAQANVIALTAIMRLRQLCISPQMIDKTLPASSPKIDYLTSNLHDIVDEGNAALVFSQFTTCLDLIETALKKEKLAYYRIDGSTKMNERKKIVAAFQAEESGTAILLLSLKTGGVGLNLTRANYVFHVDPWWNPAVEHQASDRSHRIGQKQKVFVTRLVMHHTIEEKMMALKAAKQKLFTEVMEQAATKTKSLITKRDLDMLFS
jgi:SNF2 family DNA or RNA helicase